MGTTVAVTVHGGRLDANDVLAEIDRLEQSWSRFRPDSELNRLNDCSGSLTVVSSTLLVLVEHLMAAHRLTGGRFDPTMGAQIAALGYDRTYRDLRDSSRQPVRPLPDIVRADDVVVIPCTAAVLLPAGVRLDPGGLGKGLAADLAATMACDAGADGVLIDLGGDIVTRGCAPDRGPWRIDVPSTGMRPRRILELRDGAVATSDTSVRTWTVSGVRHRHVLDPHTGLPLERDLRATVVAGAGWWAEAAATAAIISTARGDRWVDSLGTIDGISDVDVSERSRCWCDTSGRSSPTASCTSASPTSQPLPSPNP